MPSTLKGLINSLTETKNGQFLSFSGFHFFYALELMSENRVGRNKLAEQLNVGEGAVRTLLIRLKGAGLVTTSKSGCMLTDEGLRVWRELDKFFPGRAAFFRSELTPFNFNYGFVIRNGADKVNSGIEQRDKAIVVGAERALIFVFRNGQLRINYVSNDIEETFPMVARQILQQLKPQENDAVVIASGETPLKAMHGAFSASWSLLRDEEIEH